MTRRRASVAGGLLAAAVVGAWWFLGKHTSLDSRPLVAAGEQCSFDLAWDSHATTRMGGGAAGRASADLGVDIAFRGKLTIDATKSGDSVAWTLRFAPDDRSQIAVGGKALLSGGSLQTAASTARAELDLGPDGSVKELLVAGDDSKVLEIVARLVHTRLNPVWGRGGTSAWARTERNEIGDGAVRYYLRDRLVLERERDRYRELELSRLIADANATVERAATSWRWDGATGVARVEDVETTVLYNGMHEEVGRVDTRATLERVSCSASAGPAVARTSAPWVRLDPTQPLVSGSSTQESALDRRIAGLTFDGMLTGLEHLALVPHDPDKTAFLVRATGLLIQHPEYAAALVPIATRAGLSLEGQMVVLDVLASVGHDSAQAAMRDAFEHRELRRKANEYNALVQRFSFVGSPTEESLEWLEREWAQRGAAIGTAAALGSVAGRFASRGNDALARPAVNALTQSLDATSEPKRRADLLLALGNVRSPLVARAVLREARTKVPEARAAAAFALRGVDLPEARDALVELARDPLPSVALSAYAALDSQTLDRPHFEALLTDIIEGRVPASADATVVTYLAKHINESPFVVDALTAIAGRAESPDVKARAASLLRAKATPR